MAEDGQDWLSEGDHELKRVKVYELIGSRWVDQGTAFCFGQILEDTNEALLVARAEGNYDEVILSTAIRADDVYQRQQDTLIVWTELDGVDYALSFQDPEGCAEVWNFIREVQRHMNSGDNSAIISSSPIMGSDPSSITTASIIRSGQLPQPQLGIIGEIERAIKALSRTQPVKERICEYIMQEEYIKGLIEVMNTAEDLESLDNLHALCSLMQTILMLNDLGLYEHILDDDIFFGVVGMLEYDPEFPNHKANYREFLHNTSQFHQPIPIREPQIQRKIHHTYRLQFLKDVVLARVLDDSTFNVLSSCIIYNQIDIITHVQQDPNFLRDIVKLFVDEEMLGGPREVSVPQPRKAVGAGHEKDPLAMDVDPKPPPSLPLKPVNGVTNGRLPQARRSSYAFAPPENMTEEEVNLRREVILLVQQLCVMGKNVQLPARMTLFRSLVDRGVLFAVQWALGLPEKEDANRPMISAAGEILSALLDHDLNGVRGHVLKQVMVIEKEREAGRKGADKAETILEMVSRLMATSREFAVQSQVGDALKAWMEIPNTESPTAPSEANPLASRPPPKKDDPGTERYMDYFYKCCVHILFRPLHNLSEWRVVKEPVLVLTREETNRFVYLCDLLYNFLQQHNFRSSFYVLSTGLMTRLATLLKSKDKHLRHSAFRIFRLLLKQNNPNTHKQMIKVDVVHPILDLTLQESRRDNLLSCSCQEFFENMRRDNMKEMINFCMTKHEPLIRQLAETPLGGPRFELLIRRYEMNNEPPPPDEPKAEKTVDPRPWPGASRVPDEEEESYFNGDDDDEDLLPLPEFQTRQPHQRPPSPSIPLSNALKRKRRPAVGAATKGYRPPLRIPSFTQLVDYAEDENEDAVPDSSSASQTTSSLLASPLPIPTDGPPSSPKLFHRQVSASSPSANPPPPRRLKEEDDDEDNLFEALVRARPRPSTPTPGMMASSTGPGPMRPSEKRRRGVDDDDDEEGLERLTKASKKMGAGSSSSLQKARSPSPGRRQAAISPQSLSTQSGEEPPKQRFKLKLGGASIATVSISSPTPPSTQSETGAKDGDTG
ncbi:component of IIS longevity pathway SMK-1-domain-containing protein [Amanita rubescens]|nr:component of IIS longevity pathway SMK-1-domain-containing protein [Amanita rubescens]